MGQPNVRKPDFPCSTPRSSCISLVFINNLKTQEYKVTICIVLYCPRHLAVIYNMYKSMTSRRVHLHPLFVLYIYIYKFIYIYIYIYISL